MANLSVSSAYNMSSPFDMLDGLTFSNQMSSGFNASSAASHISVSAAGHDIGYAAYAGANVPVSGVITNFTVYKDASPIFQMSNAQVDIATDSSVVNGLSGVDSVNAELAYWLRGDDVIETSSGNVRGFSGNDTFYLGSGRNTVHGDAGTDTVYVNASRFLGPVSDFSIVKNSDGSTNVSWKKNPVNLDADPLNGFSDTLYGVEKLVIRDISVDHTIRLDISGNAGQAYRLYQAAFNRSPDTSGLKYWIDVLDSGVNLKDVANAFELSAEFSSLYGGNPTSGQLITAMYSNVLHRAPDQGGYDYWLNQMNTGAVGKETLLMNFSESAENQAALIGVIGNGIYLS